MIKKLFFTALIFSIINLCFVQVYGQSTANYAFSTVTNGSLIDMSSGTTDLLATGSYKNDVASSLADIGFDFIFMGSVYSQFSVNSNGQMRLGSTAIGSGAQSPTEATALLAPISGDNSIQASGKVHYKITGAAPNRILVVEWVDLRIPYSSNTGETYCKFQTLLYEADGAIEFRYGRMYNMGTSQSRSIYFASGTLAGQIGEIRTITTTPAYTNNQTGLLLTALSNSSDITNLNSTADGSRTIYTFTPSAAPAAPSSLTFSAISGTGMTLNWNDNATTETGYIIMRSTDGVNYTVIANLPVNSTLYSATGLNFGTTYYWKVLAVNEGRSSEVSGSQATSAGTICGNKTIGPTGDYASLTAAFADINANGLGCNLNLILQSTYVSTVETFPVAGPNSAPMGTYTATIYPSVTGLSITSANITGTINLNGSRNIIFDGRVNASGSTQDLIIENTSTVGFAIQFINDATNNTLKYCNIKGVNTSANRGVVFFSTTSGSTGNDNNIIEYCNLTKGATKPKCLVYSEGTASKQNSGNIIRNNNFFDFDANMGSAGIYLYSHSEGWNIIGNSFYQTSAYSGTINTTTYCININCSGNGFSITDNYLGGSAPNCGGLPWTINGTATSYRFFGIYLNVGTATATSVQNNTIKNFNWYSTTGGANVFVGISSSGLVNIGTSGKNIIGSETNDNIIINSTTGIGTTIGILSAGGTATITNNEIYGISAIANATQGVILKGISISGGNATISSNIIGSTNAASMRAGISGSTTGTTTYYGIENSGTGTISISNNIIRNGISYGANASSDLVGIINSGNAALLSINNNSVYDLNNYNCGNTSPEIFTCGIKQNNTSTGGFTITANTIYNIKNAQTIVINPIRVTGIFFSNSTNANNLCSKNKIYALSYASSVTTNAIRGIYSSQGYVKLINNMIALGQDENGVSIDKDAVIYGIHANAGSVDLYNNSVYIGGIAVTGSNPTAAFRFWSPSNNLIIKNNIFYNARNNAVGTGKHYAYDLACSQASFKVYSDYNIFYAPNSGGVLFSLNMTGSGVVDYTNLQAFRYIFKHVIAGENQHQDLHSAIADPKFIAPTAVTPNLHIQTSVATPVEGSGIAISGITDDFDGDVRSSNSPTDIGADAGNFTALDDKFTPNIAYTALTNSSGICSSSRTFTATITDVGTGVPTSGANMPRVWFKKNTGSWFSAAGTLISGNGNDGVWSFTINYTTLGGVANGDVIYYYVVAQDQAAVPNVWYTAFEAAAPIHSNVNTQTTPPASPNSFTIVPSLSGVVTVGTGGDYPTLTGPGGLFAAINGGIVTGNLTANIISDITETGENSLNQWLEDCGSGYTLTIQPNNTTVRTISGTTSNPTSMLKINRADRITINGVNKYLVFANNGSGAAIEIGDGSKKITITQCDIKSNNTANGVVYISPHSVADDGPEVTITNNNIHNYSAGNANSLICINNNYAGPTNISNNNLFDFKTTAIYINAHGTRKYTISGNQIYNTVNTSTGNYSGMYLVSGDSIEVTGNYIGGQAANCGGSAWSNTSNLNFYGIRVMNSATTIKFCEVKNNTIKNITQSGNASFCGIQIDNPNLLSSLVEGNIISDIATTYTGGITYLRGIHIAKGANVKKNKVYNLNGMPSSSYNWIMGIDFDNTTVDVNNEISNNMICLDGGVRDHFIYGIRSNIRTTSVLNTFYNTVYIKGTITVSAGNNTAAFTRVIASNENCRNNIFINTRTGTTNNFVIRTNSTSLASHISTYNLLVTAASGQVAYDGSAKDFTAWRSSGKDQSSWCALATAGSTDYANLNPADLFVDAANGDLSIKTNNAAAWYVFGKGVAGAFSNTIATDFYGNVRSTTKGMATCIGAHEFAQPAVAPISANPSAAPAAGITTTYTFGNRTICSIDWAAGSNVPTSVDVKYYSGVNPQNPSPVDAQYHNAFVRATATGGTEPFNYTMNLYYDTAFCGSVTKNADTRLSKYNTFWTTYNETSPTQSAGAVYYISKSGLTNFSDFTCSDMDHVLPVELLVFKAYAQDEKVKLCWSTASETNNAYFVIERSNNAKDWQAIAQVNGNGNSNRVLNYTAIDDTPNKGMNYYRLKQVDFDGQYSYSEVVVVNLEANQNVLQKWDITLFPNPVADVLRVKAEQIEADNLQIRIYSATGVLVKFENWTWNGSEMQVKELMLQDLQPGLYFVEFNDGTQSQTLRMVKK